MTPTAITHTTEDLAELQVPIIEQNPCRLCREEIESNNHYLCYSCCNEITNNQ